MASVLLTDATPVINVGREFGRRSKIVVDLAKALTNGNDLHNLQSSQHVSPFVLRC